MLQLERLEDRNVPSTSTLLADGTLLVNVQGGGTHTVSVDLVNQGAQVQVNLDGQLSVFDSAQVTNLVVNGARQGVNVIQNNTGVASMLVGGDKADRIFGGSGSNYIDAGKGKDLVYALLGQN